MKMCRSISAVAPNNLKKKKTHTFNSGPFKPKLIRSGSNFNPQMAKPTITRPRLYINTNV